MPFLDEMAPVHLTPYQASWAVEFDALADRISAALGAIAVSIDHIGSTAIPGMPAKDVIDFQVSVAGLAFDPIIRGFDRIGFRRRPEPWNNVEMSFGIRCKKLVFAPPAGERASNCHVRIVGQPNALYALLFRDYLRASEEARSRWAEFKTRLAEHASDLSAYGQIKAPATEILMEAASAWKQSHRG